MPEGRQKITGEQQILFFETSSASKIGREQI